MKKTHIKTIGLFTAILFLSNSNIVCSADDTQNILPSSYNLCSEGLISPIKNQGIYGTCWAHSAISSLETSIISEEPFIDLSEWHLAYNTKKDKDDFALYSDFQSLFNAGENDNLALDTFVNHGIVTENALPYATENIDDTYYYPEYQVKEAITSLNNLKMNNLSSENFQLVKEIIYDGNAVSMVIDANSKYLNAQNDCYYCNYKDFSGTTSTIMLHSMSVIGWDDNYPKENFNENSRPLNNGAWLVKNSYGSSKNSYGYYWVSYENCNGNFGMAYSCEPQLDNLKKYVCSEEKNNSIGTISKSEYETKSANIFNADEKGCLQEIKIYVPDENVDYDITVYKNLSNSQDPLSGTEAININGNEKFEGYYTIKLPENIFVDKNEDFSIVLSLKNKNETQFLVCAENAPQSDTKDYIVYEKDTDTGEINAIINPVYQRINSYFYQNDGNDTSWYKCNKGIYINAVINESDIIFSSYSKYVTQGTEIIPANSDGNTIYISEDGKEWTEYTEPVIIDSDKTVYAKSGSDGEIYQQSYKLKRAVLSSMIVDKNGMVSECCVSNNGSPETIINIDAENTDTIKLVPMSTGKILIDGQEAVSGEIFIPDISSKKSFKIKVSAENQIPTEYTILLSRYEPLKGDVNDDGEIDIRDITTLNQYTVKMVDLSEQGLKNADIISDDIIDLKDLGQLKKYIIKVIDSFE